MGETVLFSPSGAALHRLVVAAGPAVVLLLGVAHTPPSGAQGTGGDGNGLPDGQGPALGLSPLNPDTDGDGMSDSCDSDLSAPFVSSPGEERLGCNTQF